MAKQLKALMPPSFHRLRISDELAACLGIDTGGEGGAVEPAGPTSSALVASPFGKVWRVEVGRDGDGVFLERGWAEFLAAHGLGLGWFVVLRHDGGGVLTVKAFDTSFCIKEFGAPAAVMTSRSSKGVSWKPQFIRIIHKHVMKRMMIPARFVKHYVSEEYLNSRTAIFLSPLGKFWRVELEKDQSGLFFAGGWSQFLEFHGISEGEVLLLRYEGNMVFKFKVFGLNGCQKDFKNEKTRLRQNENESVSDIGDKQESPSPIEKRKSTHEKSSSEENKRPKSPVTPLNNISSAKEPNYWIGPPSWIRKEINTHALERQLSLSLKFCRGIGFRETCTITLKTEMDSTKSWKVRGAGYKHCCYIIGEGWRRFCQENGLKAGDLCTFSVIETRLWHVTIEHSSTSEDTEKQKASPCSSSGEHDTKDDTSSSEGPMGPKGSVISSSKMSYTQSVYEIGPQSWIQKEITANSLKKHLSLAWNFCDAMGLRGHSIITLKTSINSTRSWQVLGLTERRKSSYHIGSGWKQFCHDNKLKVGDVCTFNIVKTKLWHVVIKRR